MPLRFEGARYRRFNGARMFLDPTKRSQNLAGTVENRWHIAFPRERLVPRCEQWVFGFHCLQGTANADTFRAPF
jgi:hypothetical protein